MSLLKIWNSCLGTSTTKKDWNSWIWQESHAVHDIATVARFVPLSHQERSEAERVQQLFQMGTTPYYLALIRSLHLKGDDHNARRLVKSFVPSLHELADEVRMVQACKGGSGIDGMGEDGTTPFPFLSQLYKDRILLFTTHHCPFFCRYCFRRRKVILNSGSAVPETILHGDNLDKTIEYIKDHPDIRDVILSGGEPLSLGEAQLDRILSALRSIDHVKIIRIDTKIPVVMPMRITHSLLKMLRRHHPLYINIHCIHASEITNEMKASCEKLVNAGIPLGSYTPLLRGINDSRESLRDLFWNLVLCRVRPYYLVQLVGTKWTEQFRVPLMESLSLLDGIHGELSGVAVPTFKVYVPGEGKIPLSPDYYVHKTQKGHILRNWKGEEVLYEDS